MVSFKEFLLLDAAELEEMAPGYPATRDNVDRIMAEPDESDNPPRQRRRGQRAARRLKSIGYKGDRRNAQEYPSEDEMEARMPADQDRAKRFDNQVAELGDKDYKDVLHSEPNPKRMKQRFGRHKRRTWGREGS